MTPTGSIHEIRWNELCPWLILVKTWRVSLLVRVLAYAWLGLILTQWGWSICEHLAGDSLPRLERLTNSQAELLDIREQKAKERRLIASSLFQVDPQPPQRLEVAGSNNGYTWRPNILTFQEGPLIRGWSWISSPLALIFQQESKFASVFFRFLCGLWVIAVWGFFGAAIARTSARYLTREEIIGPVKAIRSAITAWPSTFSGPVLVLMLAGVLCLPLALLGFLVRADFLALLAGLFWVLTLAWGVVVAIVLVALWLGWPLMWATIAVERSDAFDAAARTASYIYQRPLRLTFYVVVASLLGIFGEIIVFGFALTGDHLTDWAVSWGAGTSRMAQLAGDNAAGVEPTLGGSATLAAQCVGFWKGMLFSLPAAYPLAYLFSSCVGIYLLLRLHVDSTEMDEIVEDKPETSSEH